MRLIRSATHYYVDYLFRLGALVDSWKSELLGEEASEEQQDVHNCFSRREFEVLQLVSLGKSNNEIAAELQIRPNTVKNHLTRMYDKVKVNNRTELVRWALRHGLE